VIPDVVEARHLSGHRLYLRFDNGRSGELDFSERLTFTGVFKPLRKLEMFAQVRVNPEIGTICWPNDADVDPVVLYSWVFGEPIEGVLNRRQPRKGATKPVKKTAGPVPGRKLGAKRPAARAP
jgi:hypothetical protein